MAKRRTDGDGSITWDASVQLWVGRLPRDERGGPSCSSGCASGTRAVDRCRTRHRQQFLDAWIREIVEAGDLASKTKQGYELTVRWSSS